MSDKVKKAVILPGSYDPVTTGHLSMIERAAAEYDEVYAVVFINPEKEYTFPLEDRVKMLMLATDELDNVLVSYSTGLVVDYMRDHGIDLIIKGYRNATDLEYERKQADWNLKNGGYETLLWESEPEKTEVSSTRVRRMLSEGLSVDGLLPKKVIEFIKNR